MKRAILVGTVSFFVGLFIFFPYASLYSLQTENIIKRYNLPVKYTVDRAGLFRVVYGKLRIKIPDYPLELKEISLELTPLKYIFNGRFCLIRSHGMTIEISKKKQRYHVLLSLKDFKNPSFGKARINAEGLIEIGDKGPENGNLEIHIKNILLPSKGKKIQFDEIKGKGHLKKGRLFIENLTIKGPTVLFIKGDVIPNYKNFERSILNLNVRYEFDGKVREQKIKGTFRELLMLINVASTL